MTQCPSSERLQQLLADQLDRVEAEAVETHIETCAQCQQALERLTGNANGNRLDASLNRQEQVGEFSGDFLRRLAKAPPAGAGLARNHNRRSWFRKEPGASPTRHSGEATLSYPNQGEYASESGGRIRPAVLRASAPQSTGELQTLLHKRLRFVSLCVLSVHSYFTVTSLFAIARNLDVLHFYWFYFLLTWLSCVGTLGLAIALWRGPLRSLLWLRAVELALFGLALADWTWMIFCDFFILGKMFEFYSLGRSPEERESIMFLFAATWCIPYVLLIVGYAALIPSGWRRCTAIVSVMAAAPILMVTAAAPQMSSILPSYLLYMVVPMVLCLGLAVTIAAFGTHRIEMLRHEAAVARKLGQYQLKQLLGAGGMGEVYLAEHVLLKRPCAIKLVRPERAGDPRNLVRFEREVQATATLNHPNTVEIFDYGHAQDGTFYYVMEYLPGLSLEQLVRRHGRLPPARAVYLLRQVCGALREAHGHGLIHRDLKPGNIIVCAGGWLHDLAKLLDFGLVQTHGLAGDGQKLTQEGALAGTPAYMSPEQAAGKADLDARSDIYSLGSVAYFLLTGQPPFVRETAVQTLAARLTETPAPLTSHCPDVPVDVQAIVLRCLEKDLGRRFQSADDLDQALARCGSADLWTREQAALWWRSHAARNAQEVFETEEQRT